MRGLGTLEISIGDDTEPLANEKFKLACNREPSPEAWDAAEKWFAEGRRMWARRTTSESQGILVREPNSPQHSSKMHTRTARTFSVPEDTPMNRTSRAMALLIAGIIVLSGCETMLLPPPQSPELIWVSIPTLTALPETQPSQEKGGISISVLPVTFTLVESVQIEDQALFDAMKREYVGDGKIYDTPIRVIERTTTLLPSPEPDRLTLQVTVINKMPRVFRVQGMVVQFNVDGKLQAIDPWSYTDLTQMIVPPRNQHTTYIYGPPVNQLPATGIVGVFLYDVVTGTDAAGNVTERQNFEWYYGYESEFVELELKVSKQRLEQRLGRPVRIR